MYSIVDIETTGGSAAYSKITEVAIYKIADSKIVDEYQSLVNPKQDIPAKITRLTGISNEMVASAPTFAELAQTINIFLSDSVFVAHNVNFDYGFMRAEFQRVGISFKRRKLCTVRLSRKLLPGKYSYSLGRLCASEGIPLRDRHRAAGDAHATALLFLKLLRIDNDGIIQKSLNPLSLEALLPPNLSKERFTSLPEKQGIYYFKDAKQKIVYIGKAKNLKKRIHSHFSGNSNTRSKYYFVKNIYDLSYQTIESSLLLDIVEAAEIKRYWPRYNKAMKRVTLNYGIFNYQDRNNYLRLSIGRCGKHEKPILTFKSLAAAKEFVRNAIIDYDLCPRLAGLQPIASGKCNYIEHIECKGACQRIESAVHYNQRVSKAIEERFNYKSSYLIKDQSSAVNAYLYVEKGRFKGYTLSEKKLENCSTKEIKMNLESAYDDQDMAILINAHLSKENEHLAITYFN